MHGIVIFFSFLLSTDPFLTLPILFESNELAIVAKPGRVPCHNPEIKHNGRTTIVRNNEGPTPVLQRAIATFPNRRIHLVHRLDAGTSGCLLLAFNADAANVAREGLARGRKTYFALCRGDGASLRDRGKFVADGDVKDSKGILRSSETEIEGLWGSNGSPRRCCLVKAQPNTGRWHQIRQHLGRENYPIIGETKHHPDRKENRAWRDDLGLLKPQRIGLHCHRIQISSDKDDGILPIGGIDVTCPLPSDMRTIIDLTDWAGDARDALPDLFEPYPINRIPPHEE